MRKPVRAALIATVPLALFWLGWVVHLEPNEAGIARNLLTGDLSLQGPGGYQLSPPWVLVSRVDLRPHRVCITSASYAAFNCKLVRFVPAHYREFVRAEGWRYWWWANRFSLNLGYREEYRGMRDILRGYAFSAQTYPFVVVERDFSP